jgi:hypothetical protein
MIWLSSPRAKPSLLASASAFNVTLVLVLGCEAGIHASNLVGQALVIANGKLKFADIGKF